MANGGYIYYRIVGENGALLDRILAVLDRQGNRPWDLKPKGSQSGVNIHLEGVTELPVDQGWCVTEASIPLDYLEKRCVPIPENEARRLGRHVFEFIDGSTGVLKHSRRR